MTPAGLAVVPAREFPSGRNPFNCAGIAEGRFIPSDRAIRMPRAAPAWHLTQTRSAWHKRVCHRLYQVCHKPRIAVSYAVSGQ